MLVLIYRVCLEIALLFVASIPLIAVGSGFKQNKVYAVDEINSGSCYNVACDPDLHLPVKNRLVLLWFAEFFRIASSVSQKIDDIKVFSFKENVILETIWYVKNRNPL